MSVLDWYCNQCGTSGVAVALKKGEEWHRVQISHLYVSGAERRKRRYRQNACHGNDVRYLERLHRKAGR